MTTALDGLRVLDFSSGLSGALVSMILCDHGAEVIRVEPPGGDPQQAMPAFRMWHRGKSRVALDLKTDDGTAQARRLAAQADVLVQNWRPGVAERLGLGYEALAAANPGLVYCAITAFGSKGPYAHLKGYEAIVTAKAGIMAENAGLADREGPCFAAVPGASYGASQTALQGILAALYVRAETGAGQKVEASLVQGLVAYQFYDWLGLQLSSRSPDSGLRSAGRGLAIGMMVGWTRDGKWLQFANALPNQLSAFLRALELEEYYRDAVTKNEDTERIEDVILRRLQERTLDEWMEIFAQHDMGVEPLCTTEEGMDHPQVVHNGQVRELDDPRLGRTRQIGPFVDMSATPVCIDRPAADLVEDAGGVGFRSRGGATATPPAQRHDQPSPPLTGVTIVELGWYYAAPFGVAILADLGARVIKVETLEGDPHRFMYPVREFAGVKALQGKQSIAVDIRKPEGKEILHRLIARVDLVMRSFRQSSSETMGVDYESLRRINPNLVYHYGAAYGAGGPSSHRPAYHPTMAAVAGVQAYQLGWDCALTGSRPLTFEQGRRIYRFVRRATGVTGNADSADSLGVGTALLLGLVARRRTGQGQQMQTTMIGSTQYSLSDGFIDYAGKPARSLPDEALFGMGALYRLYRTQRGWVFLACPQDDEWAVLCGVMQAMSGGTADLAADPRFGTREGRRANDAALAEVLARSFVCQPAAAWEEHMTGADVACVEVSDELFAHFSIAGAVMRENGFVAEVDHPVFGTYVRNGPTVCLSRTPGVAGPAPLNGQHTQAILQELGYGPDQIQALKDQRIVTWPEGPGR